MLGLNLRKPIKRKTFKKKVKSFFKRLLGG